MNKCYYLVYSGTSEQGTRWGQYKLTCLSIVERGCTLLRGCKCIQTRESKYNIFGTSSSVLFREVYCTLSLSQRVHYQTVSIVPIASYEEWGSITQSILLSYNIWNQSLFHKHMNI